MFRAEAGAPVSVLEALSQVASVRGDYSTLRSPLPGLVDVDPDAKVRMHAVSVDTSAFQWVDVLSAPRRDADEHINPAELSGVVLDLPRIKRRILARAPLLEYPDVVLPLLATL